MFLFRAESFHNIVSQFNYFNFSFNAGNPHKIAVELPVLSLATTLRSLISENIRNRIPAQGELKAFTLSGNHSGKTRGHFRPKSDLAIAFILENIHLVIYDFIAAFTSIKLSRLQNRSAIFGIARF